MHKTIPYHSGNINYYTSGKGSTHLVFLHGFLENLSMWDTIIPEFTKTHTVIAIDLPGHGKTSTLETVHTMELMADVVNMVLKKEGAIKAKFVGHSMGGYVALAFAKKHPKKVGAICLLTLPLWQIMHKRKKTACVPQIY